jgi:hypothetical protein
VKLRYKGQGEEGVLRAKSNPNRPDRAREVFHHFVVAKTQNAVTLRLGHARPCLVARALLRMLVAVGLDGETQGRAGEIDDKGPDRHLPAKFHALDPAIAYRTPQQKLGLRMIAAKLAGTEVRPRRATFFRLSGADGGLLDARPLLEDLLTPPEGGEGVF